MLFHEEHARDDDVAARDIGVALRERLRIGIPV